MQVNDYNGSIYSLSAVSGIVAAGLAAASEIAQFRWTHATRKGRILGVAISAIVDTTGFTAGAADFQLKRATAWSAAGTGGAAVTQTGVNGALRIPTLPLAGLGEFRVASTAALGAGTKTFDSTALAVLLAGAGAAGTPMIQNTSWLLDPATFKELPLVLGTNEGFSILANVPGTGTWKFGVQVLFTDLV